MKFGVTAALLFMLPASIAVAGSAGRADDGVAGGLRVEHAWARATTGHARNAAAYLTLVNDGDKVERLVAVATPAARRAELHTVVTEGGIVRMRRVRAIEVNPGESVVLAPGGLHIMLTGLDRRLEKGATLPLRVGFESGAVIDVEATVQGPASMRHDDGSSHDHKPPAAAGSRMN